ncbi:hypothetical protein [Ekhidna sp.]|jgi:hypothetical protein|uniref:hypothetical protein n=1 Tax=Ekhidna sp. TaxID=2608089 RepID=UPI0032EEF6FA
MTNSFFKHVLVALMLFGTIAVYAQLPSIQYYRYNDLRGWNVFETSKEDTVKYDGFRVRVGGGFAMQFQGISQSNDSGLTGTDNGGNTVPLDFVDLDNNMTLPTANLNFDVQLEDGLRMHLRTYLSSRHHPESYVKGGYLQIDKLDFVSPGFMSGLMDKMTIRVGMDEINYGDTHFRRSDNARALFNPFVANYIMDAFTTEPFMEFTYQSNGFIGVLGMSNGRLNQEPVPGDDGRVFYGKLGYDKQMNDDLRFRITGSFYNSSDGSTRDYLYGGDRAGARYYNVLHTVSDGNIGRGPSDFEPRWNPGFSSHTAIMINPFVKFNGLEFFGVYENTSNGDDTGGSYSQIGAELLYRFGDSERVFIGGRYNSVSGEAADGAATQDIKRTNLGFGWFMTRNVMMKGEYVTSKYDGDGFTGTKLQGAEFDGVVIEAVIQF